MKKSLLLLAFVGLTFCGWSQFVPLEGSPVTVQSFGLTKNGNDMLLQWKVACFLDEATFTIQRSANGNDYSTLHTFSADKARCSQPFYYTDEDISGKVYYRIKVSDKDGNVYASKIVSATGTNSGYNLNGMWPTLVRSDVMISISSASKDNAVLSVTSLTGQRVWQKTVALQQGSNEVRFNFSVLSRGNYVLTSTNSSGELCTIRFAKQ